MRKSIKLVERFLSFLAVWCVCRSCPLGSRIFVFAFLLGFFITFIPAVQKSHTASKHQTAKCTKNEFNKYEQWELPSNDQLPSTRQGLQSIPDNPARSEGALLDHTKGNMLHINCLTSALLGMKIREELSNCNLTYK